ncbi:hypothetical protein NJ7G_0152 [Natrinema sp. J7-2]|nr:hypothetical protein NJ7G_0152 [Natrinema sp. J7-2]
MGDGHGHRSKRCPVRLPSRTATPTARRGRRLLVADRDRRPETIRKPSRFENHMRSEKTIDAAASPVARSRWRGGIG